jgi:hypothetical protein
MPANVAPNHPKRTLLFFVAQDLDDSSRANIRDFVLHLASLRRWLNGPPRFVSSRDEPANTSHGDMAVETVGGYLEIYSVLPPCMLPREIDFQQLDEVRALLNSVRDFSREHRLSIEFELDGELIGAIDEGQMDRSLAEGLLEEWQRRLGK